MGSLTGVVGGLTSREVMGSLTGVVGVFQGDVSPLLYMFE
jgi:hypothetical protein